MKSRVLPNLMTCLTLVLVASSLALGQGTTSRVAGTVQDVNGAAVGGAIVTLANDATGVSFSAETGDSGAYAFDLVQVGKYSLTIEKQGSRSSSVRETPSTSISRRLSTPRSRPAA
jgi:hypothetical protein